MERKNKNVIWAILIIAAVIIAVVIGYFLLMDSNNKKLNDALVTGYGLGYNKSLQDVAQGQTQTGTILVWANDSVQVRKVQDICGVFIAQQGQQTQSTL
jgi:hypothetical protein